MSTREQIRGLGRQARLAARAMTGVASADKNAALGAVAEALLANAATLQEANQRDLEAGRESRLAEALLDRLTLTPRRIGDMADGLRQIARLPDPVGQIQGLQQQAGGIRVGRMRVPLGVVGIIYESRPNVTADAAGLCLKVGNASILRGGSEALHSNLAIARLIRRGLIEAGLPEHLVQVIDTPDRAAVGAMLEMSEYIDILIPRGGKGLIERVSAEAKMPVLKHLDGLCHVFIDAAADMDKATAIAFNAKTQRCGTCNAMECLLVDETVAEAALARLGPMFVAAGVELRVCPRSRAILEPLGAESVLATGQDYATEYLAPILSVKVVAGLEEAMEHIAKYGSQHTDAIITEDLGRAQRFLREVDSSSVMVNASTRFADGYEYGLGAEIGISTDKLHARGPVGLEGLTSEKFIVLGDGQIRE